MKKFSSIGLVNGLIWQVIGIAVGIGYVTLMRYVMHLPAWKAEPAVVVGMLLGAIFFLYGVGVLDDWLKWAAGRESGQSFDETHSGWRRYFGSSLDHKVIGVQYLSLALTLMSIAGIFAMIFRIELAQPKMQILTLDQYNTLMSLHGIVMIISILMGVAAFMNYLVPMLIGARDMAFPRLNSFSFWIAVPAGLILLSSLVLGGFDTGWTGYPPLSARAPLGMQMFFLGVSLAGFSSIFGGLNIIATIIRMRAKGMQPFRMPIFVWAALATSLITLTATELIGLSFQMVMLQRLLGMGFFDPAKGGNPILFQHLFWFYSHPAVYVFVLPGLGIISELLPVFARKPLFGYRAVALSSLAIALIGFLVWGHHMFASGMAEYLRVPFMYSTLLIAVPTGVKFFSWLGTVW
ncbi:MAG: cytochrome c oxidase subunit I, partial [Anaerolineales bacterium]